MKWRFLTVHSSQLGTHLIGPGRFPTSSVILRGRFTTPFLTQFHLLPYEETACSITENRSSNTSSGVNTTRSWPTESNTDVVPNLRHLWTDPTIAAKHKKVLGKPTFLALGGVRLSKVHPCYPSDRRGKWLSWSGQDILALVIPSVAKSRHLFFFAVGSKCLRPIGEPICGPGIFYVSRSSSRGIFLAFMLYVPKKKKKINVAAPRSHLIKFFLRHILGKSPFYLVLLRNILKIVHFIQYPVLFKGSTEGGRGATGGSLVPMDPNNGDWLGDAAQHPH